MLVSISLDRTDRPTTASAAQASLGQSCSNFSTIWILVLSVIAIGCPPQGRVLVLHQELDPATLTPGTLVTFVGEVSGATIEKMDEDDYRYPTLTVKHWHVWSPPSFQDRRGGRYFGVFGGAGVGGGSRGGGGVGIGF